MSQIASKNLYELLGNDPELDPERATPVPPTKVVDKPVQRVGKRNGPLDGPNGDRASAGVRGGRQAGTTNNRSEQRDDGLRQDRHRDRVRDPRDRGRGQRGERRGAGRGRGDAGSRTVRDPRVDRHSNTGVSEHDKQAAHGWGGETANAEWTDEQAGDAIAAAELKNDAGLATDSDAKDPAFGNGPDLATEDGAVAFEEEDKTKSYEQYIKEREEKRQTLLGGAPEIRKANEGSKQKFPEGKAHARDPEEENYFAGGSGKAKREKEIKQKNLLTVDGQYYAAPDSGDRGGRGGRGRGGRGRGEARGDSRGGRGGRGRGEGRGNYRGDGPRAGGRGGFNANDQSAFPALGGN